MPSSGIIALARQAVCTSDFRTDLGGMWKSVDLRAIKTGGAISKTSRGQWVVLLGAQKKTALIEAGCA